MEILKALGIRPTQLVIQMVGFLILFLTLARLLWKPLLGLMEQREKDIADTYAKAEKAKKDAEDLEAQYKTKVAKIQEEAQEKITEAVHRGNKMAEEIVEAARKEADMEKKKAVNTIQEEATRARMALRDYALGLSFDLAGRVLEKEVTRQSHEDLVKTFISELDTLSAEKN
jgi:F-type H+-transporting ATPase subunit b